MKRLTIIIGCLLLMPYTGYAGEKARTLISADLKQEPYADAQSVGTLSANSDIEVLKRRGGWVQVKSGTLSDGWLKMTNIKYGDTPAAKGDTGWGSLLNIARSGRSGNTGVTVTTGVRGLSPEELKNATPNPDAVKKMDAFPKGRGEAQKFASEGKLQTQQVEYLASSKPSEKSGGSFFSPGRK